MDYRIIVLVGFFIMLGCFIYGAGKVVNDCDKRGGVQVSGYCISKGVLK